ncbi:MFS transporter [Demequina capsici]|uniref:MFS transporter n=1 Tax=Demequina capsici TaxID=3075620 RepID=A0AA96FFU2_9MICO|nr:MFS transporter [Demequina sp. PMTSA13]WNM28657.1 MFS transporter [Demequina sp. PMTSA13]
MISATAPTDHSSPIRRIERRFVALTALRWLPVGFKSALTVLLLSERGVPAAAIGVVLAVYSVTVLLLELPTGGLADTWGYRPVLITASLVAVASTAALGLVTSTWALIAAFMLGGLARALDSGPLQAWFVDTTRAHDPDAPIRRGITRAGATESLALALGALGATALIALVPLPSHGARVIAMSAPFLVAAALGIVNAAFLWSWVTGSPHGPRVEVGRGAQLREAIASGLRLARASARVRRILAIAAAGGAAMAGVELLAPLHFADMLGGEGAAAGTYSLLVTCGFIGSAVGSLASPFLVRLARAPHRAILVGAVGASIMLAAISTPTPWRAATAFVAFYVMLGTAMPLVDELTHEEAATGQRSTMLSLNSMAMQVTAIAMSAGAGAAAGVLSPGTAMLLPAAVLALGTLVLLRWPAATRTIAAPLPEEDRSLVTD